MTVRVNDAEGAGTEAARGAAHEAPNGAAHEAAHGAAQAAEETRGLRVEVRNGPPDASAVAPGLPGGGHGLVGLRERAQLLGGTLEAGPTEEGGFVVRADFPKTPRVTGPTA
ncbi:hypothetical protein SVIO_051100 [Streptomyces violaceusniger]|uniref:Signal transduction histidine kinase subgroup 3 dimerisation and phosphoacceptor domain-containing protein n=1 Tax=Streptomyces violaceusniger TaxID=68280 RepID=A0A4D4L751_STRVO|nr:hypothetical protein SVIO_051100 [Streptomyces violaceusniger]